MIPDGKWSPDRNWASNWSNLRRKYLNKIPTDINVLSSGPKESVKDFGNFGRHFPCATRPQKSSKHVLNVLKIEKLSHIMGPINPNTRNGARLRSPSPIMAPARASYRSNKSGVVLYSAANDPRPQMIPKLDRKWSRTANDPRCGPQMIQPESKVWHGVWFPGFL